MIVMPIDLGTAICEAGAAADAPHAAEDDLPILRRQAAAWHNLARHRRGYLRSLARDYEYARRHAVEAWAYAEVCAAMADVLMWEAESD